MSNTDLLSGDAETQSTASGSENVTVDTAPQTTGSTQADGNTGAPKRRAGGLSGMVIAELRELAGELGVSDTTGMRKGDLIAVIRERQGKSKRRAAGADDAGPVQSQSVQSESALSESVQGGQASARAAPAKAPEAPANAQEAPAKAEETAGVGQADTEQGKGSDEGQA
ncbi:MAG: Rho termination factor N-terminal domain-containing protein, partial [Haloechinothrix sp.]